MTQTAEHVASLVAARILHVAALVHGRVLVRDPEPTDPALLEQTAPLRVDTSTLDTDAPPSLAASPRPDGAETGAPLLVVCHGYGEDAAAAFAAAARIPGLGAWRLVAPQALSRFYTKTGDVVASWMTRQDRELAIADNAGYFAQVFAELQRLHGVPRRLAFAGFSQGTAMAWRAATRSGHRPDAMVMLGGDVPAEVLGAVTPGLRVLIGRGEADTWYNAEKLAADRSALERAGARVEVVEFAGGHEWGQPFLLAAGRFLASLVQ